MKAVVIPVHHNVQENQGKLPALGCADSLQSVAGRLSLKAAPLHNAHEKPADSRIIVSNQYLFFSHRSSSLSGPSL